MVKEVGSSMDRVGVGDESGKTRVPRRKLSIHLFRHILSKCLCSELSHVSSDFHNFFSRNTPSQVRIV